MESITPASEGPDLSRLDAGQNIRAVPQSQKVPNSQMRALFVGNFLSAGGSHRSVIEDLAEKLSPFISSMHCVSPHRRGFIRGVHMCLTAVLRGHEFDIAVVDVYSGRAFIWADVVSYLLRFWGCPFVLVLRGGMLPEFAHKHPRRVRECFLRASAVTVPSRYLRDQLQAYIPESILLPNPLNMSAYQYTLRIKPRPRLIWVRSFHKIYNPALAPKVLSLLVQDFPDVHLTMIGGDKGDGSLIHVRHIAEQKGLVRRMHLPGGVSKTELPRWFNTGDIFLNTTDVDNTPVTVLEAMACGLCVVSTNVGGLSYILEHEKDALLVSPNDPEEMSSAVRRILTEPGLAARLSNNARRKVTAFDWEMILPQWHELLGRLRRVRRK